MFARTGSGSTRRKVCGSEKKPETGEVPPPPIREVLGCDDFDIEFGHSYGFLTDYYLLQDGVLESIVGRLLDTDDPNEHSAITQKFFTTSNTRFHDLFHTFRPRAEIWLKAFGDLDTPKGRYFAADLSRLLSRAIGQQPNEVALFCYLGPGYYMWILHYLKYHIVYHTLTSMIEGNPPGVFLVLIWRICQCLAGNDFDTERETIRSIYWVENLKPRPILDGVARANAISILITFFKKNREEADDLAQVVINNVYQFSAESQDIYSLAKVTGYSEAVTTKALNDIKQGEVTNVSLRAPLAYLAAFPGKVSEDDIEGITAKVFLSNIDETEFRKLHIVLQSTVKLIEGKIKGKDASDQFKDHILQVAALVWNQRGDDGLFEGLLSHQMALRVIGLIGNIWPDDNGLDGLSKFLSDDIVSVKPIESAEELKTRMLSVKFVAMGTEGSNIKAEVIDHLKSWSQRQ